MKLYAIYTQSHQSMYENWFRPTLRDELEVSVVASSLEGNWEYMERGFRDAVLEKCDVILSAIDENMDRCFVYSDVDIQFFGPIREPLERAIDGFDIVCQNDHPQKQLCTGFFIARGSRVLRQLWQRVRTQIVEEWHDQSAFNRLISGSDGAAPTPNFDYLPPVFLGGGTLTGRTWRQGDTLPIPAGILMHHANWTSGVSNKIAQLEYVRNAVLARQ